MSDTPEFNPPRVFRVWGYQINTQAYAVGLLWSRVPPEERVEGQEIYRRHLVVTFYPIALRVMWRELRRVFSFSAHVRLPKPKEKTSD